MEASDLHEANLERQNHSLTKCNKTHNVFLQGENVSVKGQTVRA